MQQSVSTTLLSTQSLPEQVSIQGLTLSECLKPLFLVTHGMKYKSWLDPIQLKIMVEFPRAAMEQISFIFENFPDF